MAARLCHAFACSFVCCVCLLISSFKIFMETLFSTKGSLVAGTSTARVRSFASGQGLGLEGGNANQGES